MSQHHPEYVSLVWGAIKFCFIGMCDLSLKEKKIMLTMCSRDHQPGRTCSTAFESIGSDCRCTPTSRFETGLISNGNDEKCRGNDICTSYQVSHSVTPQTLVLLPALMNAFQSLELVQRGPIKACLPCNYPAILSPLQRYSRRDSNLLSNYRRNSC